LFRDYTNGLPGLWMSHFIDLVPWFLGTPYPKSVSAQGGVYLWKDGRETEDVFHALLEYPNDCLVRFGMTLTNTSGSRNMWYGTKGTVDADKLQLLSEGSRAPDRVSDRPIEKEQPIRTWRISSSVCATEKPRAPMCKPASPMPSLDAWRPRQCGPSA